MPIITIFKDFMFFAKKKQQEKTKYALCTNCIIYDIRHDAQCKQHQTADKKQILTKYISLALMHIKISVSILHIKCLSVLNSCIQTHTHTDTETHTPLHSCHRRCSASSVAACRSDRWRTTSSGPECP